MPSVFRHFTEDYAMPGFVLTSTQLAARQDSERRNGSVVAAATLTPELITAVADAMSAKRRELIAQPLGNIWRDLAAVAIAEVLK